MASNLVVPIKLRRETLKAIINLKNIKGDIIDGKEFAKYLLTVVPEIKKQDKVIIRQLMMHISEGLLEMKDGKVIIRG
jgi:hypothetical protein